MQGRSFDGYIVGKIKVSNAQEISLQYDRTHHNTVRFWCK